MLLKTTNEKDLMNSAQCHEPPRLGDAAFHLDLQLLHHCCCPVTAALVRILCHHPLYLYKLLQTQPVTDTWVILSFLPEIVFSPSISYHIRTVLHHLLILYFTLKYRLL